MKRSLYSGRRRQRNVLKKHGKTWGLTEVLTVLLFVAMGWAAPLAADTYEAGSPIQGIAMMHEVLDTPPGPFDRATIGIGEQVWLSYYGYFVDHDVRIDSEGNRHDELDMKGTVTWSKSGPGELTMIEGETTTYVAAVTASDYTVTITMTVDDSNTMGNDPPVSVSITLDVKVPTGAKVHSVKGNYPWYAPPKGTDEIGARTHFWIQVLPDTVTFCNLPFWESHHLLIDKWPNGDDFNYGEEAGECSFWAQQIGGQLVVNVSTDECATGPYMYANLKDKVTQVPQPKTFTRNVDIQWRVEGTYPHPTVATKIHKIEYKSTGECQLRIEGLSANGSGDWEGGYDTSP